MGIEFVQQPPKKTGDVKLSFPFEQTPSEYERDGLDSVWVQLGVADASEVYTTVLGHIDKFNYEGLLNFDYDFVRHLLHDAAKELDEVVRDSYLSGVDSYIDKLEQADIPGSTEF